MRDCLYYNLVNQSLRTDFYQLEISVWHEMLAGGNIGKFSDRLSIRQSVIIQAHMFCDFANFFSRQGFALYGLSIMLQGSCTVPSH